MPQTPGGVPAVGRAAQRVRIGARHPRVQSESRVSRFRALEAGLLRADRIVSAVRSCSATSTSTARGLRQLDVSTKNATPTFDMSDPYNRAVFTQDVDFMFREVIVPYIDYYVTMNGRAVIYLWNTENMLGDFASLLNEIKARYPVAFIGSETHKPRDGDAAATARVDALDGFMVYSVLDPDNEGNYSREQYQPEPGTRCCRRSGRAPGCAAAVRWFRSACRRCRPAIPARGETCPASFPGSGS